MFEAEIMITGYTIVVVSCTIGISKLLSRKRTKQIQREISELKASLVVLANENKKLKATNYPNLP
ncbi:MAG TPA: hypothetical protein PK657_03415 [Legionella sp.]|nr:hypothetical protein [Legionella sp.]